MISKHRQVLRQRGFTIIELMIATAVLSTILVLVTVMMISIGNLYYKGINQARVQDDTRSITDDVSQHLQLSDGWLPANNASTHAYCIGGTRYTYVLYRQIGNDTAAPAYQSPHVLWRDKNPTPGSCSITGANLVNLNSQNPSNNLDGTELIAPRSRLTTFSISGISPYAISVSVAFGDNDLLCDVGAPAPGDCTFSDTGPYMQAIVSGTKTPTSKGAIHCKGTTGDQFCSTANLDTTVVRRLTGN